MSGGKVVAWMLEYVEDGEVEREYNGHDQFSCGRTGGQPLVLQSDLAAAIARAEAAERDAAMFRRVMSIGKLPVRCSTGYYYADGVIHPTPEAAIAAQQAEGEDRG